MSIISMVSIFLEQRKNDQFREGSWVMIARSDEEPCPVKVVENFIAQGKHTRGSRFFCKVIHTNNGFCLKEQAMTYSRAAQLFKMELGKEGLNKDAYGLHSLRSGGASAAAALGVPDRLFQRHGGWHSEKSRNNYLEESLDSLLLVSRTINKT